MTKKELILARLENFTSSLQSDNSFNNHNLIFGKQGEVHRLFKLLRFVPAPEKPEVGEKINEFVKQFQKS